MTRRKSEQGSRSSNAIPRRGPSRAGAAAAESADTADIFDRLARCPSLLTANELASLLAVSPKTIYSYAARNIIPHYKIAATLRFRARDIAEWLRSHAA